jgi:hypothetical protein
VAIKAELLEEYVTGAVLDALESPRVQEALRDADQHNPRRAQLLADIESARQRRADARRDYAEGTIDRADWPTRTGPPVGRPASTRSARHRGLVIQP